MCYDIAPSTDAREMETMFPNMKIQPNIEFNFDPVHVIGHAYPKTPIIVFENGSYEMRMMEWGLIPNYMNTHEKILKGRKFMLNAQSEKLKEKNSVWYRLRQHRCLVPVTGIYEHREVAGFKTKIPYFVRQHGRKIFFLPGLYSNSPLADPETGEVKETYTFFTRNANEVMKQIHNGGDQKFRMPLFLPYELEQKWLLPDLTDEEIIGVTQFEFPSEELAFHPVWSVRSKKERPDGKAKNEEYEYENLPKLEYELKNN